MTNRLLILQQPHISQILCNPLQKKKSNLLIKKIVFSKLIDFINLY